MKFKCVLSACNLNSMYCDFIPNFVKAWNILYPEVTVKIVLVAESIPEKFNSYEKNIILFQPIPGVSTSFISQYIRLLYPCILKDVNEGILITDMDMYPMNNTYYSESIKTYTNDKFIHYRSNVMMDRSQMAICYNIATSKVWRDIFAVNTLENIIENIKNVYKDIKYEGIPGKSGWSKDQLDLFTKVLDWNKKTKNLILLKDNETKFNRLDRSKFFKLTPPIVQKIKEGFYSDCHTFRPYDSYKKINDEIISFLTE